MPPLFLTGDLPWLLPLLVVLWGIDRMLTLAAEVLIKKKPNLGIILRIDSNRFSTYSRL